MKTLATCTVAAISGAGKAIRLLPYGVFRANDGRPAGLEGWELSASNAATIIRAADAQTNDFVIDYENQTLQAAKNGQPSPAAGWFKRLEWREGDGLYALDVRWTPRASAMIISGEYRYVSPVFNFDKNTGAVTKLISVAITNTPALDGLTDIAAAKRMIGYSESSSMTYTQKVEANEVLRRAFGESAALFEV